MALVEFKVSLFGGQPGDYRERFDIQVVASSKGLAIERAYAVANALYGIIGMSPQPLHRHKTYELGERHMPGLTDGEVIGITMGHAPRP